MKLFNARKPIVLSVLFFLPVTFLLFLYPSKHNYETLDIVKSDITELKGFISTDNEPVFFENKISVVAFLGAEPMDDATLALNLKELIYDKFLGFKRFQVLVLVPNSAKDQVYELDKELNSYIPMEYWTFAFGSDQSIRNAYSSLRVSNSLQPNLSTSSIFIIDKERNQRGRLDDRTKQEIEANSPVYSLYSYNVLEVSELKNKMSDDIRILFTEYRQKRKGNFDSTSRRANDLLK